MPTTSPTPPPAPLPSPFRRIIGLHPLFFSVVSLGIVGALMFFFLVVPAVRAVQPGGSASVSDIQTKLDNQKLSLAAKQKVIAAVATLPQQDTARIVNLVPNEIDLPGLLVMLERISISAGVAILGLDFTVIESRLPLNVPPGVKTVDLAMNISNAHYDQIKLFLQNLEKNLRLFEINAVIFSPRSGSASVNIRTYFIPSAVPTTP